MAQWVRAEDLVEDPGSVPSTCFLDKVTGDGKPSPDFQALTYVHAGKSLLTEKEYILTKET